MSHKLRKGDQVIVIAGNDRGKVGQVLAKLEDRVLVEGVNVRKKHMRPTQQQQAGQIIDLERPIHISNVRPCVGGKPVRLRVRKNKEGKRELYTQEGKKQVLFRPVNKQAKK